jgi:hypothetical protein
VSTVDLWFMQRYLGWRMAHFGYEPDQVELPFRAKPRAFADQQARALAWRTVEAAKMRWPRVVRRRPGSRMIISDPASPTARSAR